jgi:uncharacterized membrane protein YbhN (UPF0104 family)
MRNSPGRNERFAVGAVAAVLLVASAAYIALTFQWAEAARLLAGADLAWFFAGGGAAIVAYWVVRALRWRILMGGMQVRTAFLDLYLCSSVALSLSVLTPLQSGEALKVELLRKYAGLERAPGYSAFLLERVADLYVIAAIGAVALLSSTLSHALLLLALFLALPIAAYMLLHRVRLPGRFGQFVAHLQGGVSTPSALALLLLTTFLGWAIVAFGWHASLYSLAIRLDFAQMLGLLSVITLATIASFIPGGLGIAEAGTAEMLKRYGVDAPLAQAGALALRGFSILVILLGLVHLVLLRVRGARGPGRHAGDSP